MSVGLPKSMGKMSKPGCIFYIILGVWALVSFIMIGFILFGLLMGP